MLNNIFVAAVLACALLFPAGAEAQPLDLTKRFQVIARKDIPSLHGDLSRAGKNNIRVATGSPTGGDEILLLLEQDPDKGAYEYYIVSASDPQDIEKQLSLGAREGFKFLPNTLVSKSRTFGSGDIVMIMEKGPRHPGSYEYLLLDASLASTMQVTLSSAIDEGYHVVGMFTKKNALLVILEKKAG